MLSWLYHAWPEVWTGYPPFQHLKFLFDYALKVDNKLMFVAVRSKFKKGVLVLRIPWSFEFNQDAHFTVEKVLLVEMME